MGQIHEKCSVTAAGLKGTRTQDRNMLIGFSIRKQLAVSPQGGAEMMLLLWHFIFKTLIYNPINDFCDQGSVCPLGTLSRANLNNGC